MNTFILRHFVKNYEHVEDSAVREQYGKLAGLVGIISNTLLCILKICIGLLTSSIAIIADGINNLTDAGSSVITLIGFKLSSMPEDKEHPYGHARIEYLSGLIVSIIIIFLGFQLLITSVKKILHPEPLQFSYMTIVILLIAILVKIWQARFFIHCGKAIHSVTLSATGKDSRNDVLSTSAVLFSVLLEKFTGMQADGIAGSLVALFIIWSGIQLVKETSSPLLGESPDPALVSAIARRIRDYEGVLGLHDLVVHNYGPGKIFASVHIEVNADGDLMESHDMIDTIERTLSTTLKIHLVVHMDPIRINDPLVKELHQIISGLLAPLDGALSLHDLRIVPGPTHTNIIFDVVLSADCHMAEDEIKALISEEVQRINPSYFVVITFDKAYNEM